MSNLLIVDHLKERYPNIPTDEYYYAQNVFEVLQTVLEYYPAKSEVYDNIIFNTKRDLKDKYGESEYILCIERDAYEIIIKEYSELKERYGSSDEINDEFIGLICKTAKFVPRYICEYNPKYVQISVASKFQIKDTDKYLFEKSLDGPLCTKITLVQGHTSYSSAINGIGIAKVFNVRFRKYIADEIFRELQEEIEGFTKAELDYKFKPFTFVLPSNDFRTIDAYHLGIIMNGTIECDDIEKLNSLEPGKHQVILLSEDELKQYPREALDTYVCKAFSIR